MTKRLEFLIAAVAAASFTLVWLVADGQMENAVGYARLFAGIFLAYSIMNWIEMHGELLKSGAEGIRSLIGRTEVDP